MINLREGKRQSVSATSEFLEIGKIQVVKMGFQCIFHIFLLELDGKTISFCTFLLSSIEILVTSLGSAQSVPMPAGRDYAGADSNPAKIAQHRSMNESQTVSRSSALETKSAKIQTEPMTWFDSEMFWLSSGAIARGNRGCHVHCLTSPKCLISHASVI